jgi:hypothetical protein
VTITEVSYYENEEYKIEDTAEDQLEMLIAFIMTALLA